MFNIHEELKDYKNIFRTGNHIKKVTKRKQKATITTELKAFNKNNEK